MYRILIFSICISLGFAMPAEQTSVQLEPAKLTAFVSKALDCVKEVKVDMSVVSKRLRQNDYTSEDDTTKDFLHCVAKKMGALSAAGEINNKAVLDFYPATVNREAVTKALDMCKKENRTDTRDTFFNFLKCYKQNSPVRINFSKAGGL